MPTLYRGGCMASKTSKYYKKNPKAAARRRKQQRKYNKTRKEREAKAKSKFEEDLKERGISRTFGPQSR